ncbi:MAG: FAD-linked oxidase C-terminal domain-containing protein [Deltaproteobacteria bacterium]
MSPSGKRSLPVLSAGRKDASDSALAARLRREVRGEVLFDAAARGRYATDASIYQIDPIGVVVPEGEQDVQSALAIARDAGVPVLARGGGTSQCGQTVGRALVIDHSKHLNRVIEFDRVRERVVVEPGIVLDSLNAYLKPHGLWYPVDVSTSAVATLGGMAGNNSCGSRSIRYGNMVHNVHAIDALLMDGSRHQFGEVSGELNGERSAEVSGELASSVGSPGYRELVRKVRAIALCEADEIERRVPKLLRRVGGYNLDRVGSTPFNMAHLLVGSEGTLAWSSRLHLKLSPLPQHKALGVCHFPSLHDAMEATQHIVALEPVAVELVDRTLIRLARDNPDFSAKIGRFLRGDPGAILLVEFVHAQPSPAARELTRLAELLAELGFPDSVVSVTQPALQRDVWDVRKAGLNIMMSMKGDGKPVSFIEDCAVPLEHLAEYTDQLTRVFEKHGTEGTWYAHASVGCLHVRPVLDMRRDGAQKMRAIAEEAAELVRRYKGVYSGEHGDGLVRSEWIEPFFGPRLTAAFGEIKRLFDPMGLLNPGKIINPPKQDDRSLFRYKPDYRVQPLATVLDWSEWGGFDRAIEMCNNNGHCRKFDAGTMCPSYRATRDEVHTTRGRANTLRLALSGQLGSDAFTSHEMYDALELCVSCKGCRRECPTGVDMAKMKVEFLHHYRARHGVPLRDRVVAYLPRYAALAARAAPLSNWMQSLSRGMLGFSRRRTLPRWRTDFIGRTRSNGIVANATAAATSQVVLFVDTFNRYFEPENTHAALRVLEAAGYRVQIAEAADGGRPLCCGRTFLENGLIEAARVEARRVISALQPWVERGVPVVGLEPSCLFSLRDEFASLEPGASTRALGQAAFTFEEFAARELAAGRFAPALRALPQKKALLHGHCHQKAFAVLPDVERVLRLVPELEVETIESSCCGMAGSFGYEAKHYALSMQMAELSLLPKLRSADAGTLVVADGTSCRQQIAHGVGRSALHVARVLELALGE